MTTIRRMGALLALFCVACPKKISPKFPEITPAPVPEPVISYAQLPITVPLEAVRGAADSELPGVLEAAAFNHSEDGGPDAPSCGWNAGFRVERDPLAMTGSGEAITTTLHVRYKIKARKRVPCPGPLITASCGYDGEWPRRVTASFTTRIAIQPDWTASVSSQRGPVVPGNACSLTIANFDVTPKIIGFFKTRLNDMLARLDSEASRAIDLRGRASQLWQRLSQPLQIADGVWLAIRPEGLGLAPIEITSSELRAGIQLRALPVVRFGSPPSATTTPLPNVESVQPGSSFYVLLPVELSHKALADQLRAALHVDTGGTLFPPTGSKKVRIVDADVYGYGQQVVVKLRFVGDAKGQLYFTGTPQYNAVTNVISFPDLDYDVDTRNLIVKFMDWFRHDDFRAYLRGRLTLNLSAEVGRAREQLAAALNRSWDSVALSGTVADVRLLGFYGKPEDATFIAYVQTTGTLSLAIAP